MKNVRMKRWVFGCAAALACARCGEQASFYSNTFRSDVFVQQYDETNYDFLWMIDNSATMHDKQAYIANNVQTFVNILTTRKAVNYQMAVVNVDYFSNQGNLVQNSHGLSVVSNMTSSTPVQDFSSIVSSLVDTPTNFWDQGLESIYQATVKHGSQFSRTGVPLVIIFVTDGEDFSCQSNCTGYEPPHNYLWNPFPIDRYATYFTQLKAQQNSEVLVFPVVGYTGLSQCDFEQTGSRYVDFMRMVSPTSVVGSVCINDIQNSYDNIARVIADRGTVFPLTEKANGQGISVYISGALVPNDPNNYIYDPVQNAIIFTGSVPPKGANIQVIYNHGATDSTTG